MIFDLQLSISFTTELSSNELIYVSDFEINILSETEIILTESKTENFQLLIDIKNVFENRKIENIFKGYKYYQLVELTQEDLAQKEKFLTDYHTLNWLSREAGISKVELAEAIIALSNLLRFCAYYGVDEIHLLSLRLFRKFSDTLKKNLFIITEY